MEIYELEMLLKVAKQKQQEILISSITEQKILFLKENNIPLGTMVVGTCEQFIFEGVISLINESENNPNYECVHIRGKFAKISRDWNYEFSISKGSLEFVYNKLSIVKSSFQEAIMEKLSSIVSYELENIDRK